ncbi:hypothetical protein SUGI_0739370 [Cryptomeria japonica]|nr:hypothetical protein SUGI_0739370 [Cryptomeria japonica]
MATGMVNYQHGHCLKFGKNFEGRELHLQDPFATPFVSQPSSVVEQDLFGVSSVSQPTTALASNNGGWATFDWAPQSIAGPAAAPVSDPLQSLVAALAPQMLVHGPLPIPPSVQPSNGIPASQSHNGLLSSTASVGLNTSQTVQPARSVAKPPLPNMDVSS